MADLSIGTTIGGFAAYHAGNYFPDKTTVGLGSVNNWGASDSYTTASSTTYATSAAVKGAYDAAMAAVAGVTAPTWASITGKPATFAPSAHTHTAAEIGAMADGGSYGTVTFNNWVRTTGNTGWYNDSYGGGINMVDSTWVRTSHQKKFYVENTGFDAIYTAGGIKAESGITIGNVSTGRKGIQGLIADNDYWAIFGAADATNAGRLIIGTGDDGTEPIAVAQYSGAPLTGTPVRTAYLLDSNGNTSFPGVVTASRMQVNGGGAIFEYHSPGVAAYAHVISGNTLETWQSNGAGGWITTFNRQYPNGAYWINGNLWAANFNHGYAGQPGIMAPITVDMGVVSGASDYYPMIRQLSVSSGYGYTTRVELGTLRSGNSAWGVGNLIVGSHESSSHPSAVYAFDISGNFTAPGNVTAYSDERLKKNLEVIPDALAKLDSVRCMTFDRVDRELRQAGVIAQDIQQVLPEAVQVDQDGYLTVAYGALVALAIKAIQELKQRVEDLERNG